MFIGEPHALKLTCNIHCFDLVNSSLPYALLFNSLQRPKTADVLCKECFYEAFENEIHFTITRGQLFKSGCTVAVAASGGKDSTVLAYILKHLNEKYEYGLKLVLLSIDEGITGYRDDSLETVKQNRDDYEMPLQILSYKELYGWSMDEIVRQVKSDTIPDLVVLQFSNEERICFKSVKYEISCIND